MRLRLLAEAAVSGACPDSEFAMALGQRVVCRTGTDQRRDTGLGRVRRPEPVLVGASRPGSRLHRERRGRPGRRCRHR